MAVTSALRLAIPAVAALLGLAMVAPSARAVADPADDPCQLAVTFLCRLMPIAPDLDRNIDMTQLQPPADPAAPLPEDLPPPDVCAFGCV